MSSSIVREAFETSVTCSPQSFQSSHESIVPKARSPAAPAFASSHSSFVAEKYGSGTRPVRSRISSTGSSAQRAAVRRSCQTIARPIGAPLRLSQTSVVSRWFVIPIASSSPAPTPASARAPRPRRPPSARSPPRRARRARAPGSAAGAPGSRVRASAATRPGRGRWCRSSPGRSRGARVTLTRAPVVATRTEARSARSGARPGVRERSRRGRLRSPRPR